MPKGVRCVGLVALASLLASAAFMAATLRMQGELARATGELARVSGELSEMRAQTTAEEQPSLRGKGDAGGAKRRLAKLNLVDWTSAAVGSGCVRVDVHSSDVTLPLNTKACNGHACPPCFGLNTTPGVTVGTANFTGCGEMWVSEGQQLGSGAFQAALQQLEFINLNSQSSVAISDGARTFLIPPGAHVWGDCLAGGSDEINLDMSLQKYFRPGATFSLLTSAAPWTARTGHAAVVRADGAVLVMGGLQVPGGELNDVYSSADGGATWAQLTSSADWNPRQEHAVVVRVDGAVLVLGGGGVSPLPIYYRDVWSSADGGTTWTNLASSAAWSARAVHAAVVLADGTVLVMGGFDGSNALNDVYSSADGGATWTQLTSAAAWSGRYMHAAVVRKDGVVLVLGGSPGTSSSFNDVYSSADGGASWTLLTSSAPWGARRDLGAVVRADGAVLVLGGYTFVGFAYLNDVWGSTDGGTTWTQLTSSAAWSTRALGHAVVVRADGGVVVLGGGHSGGRDVYSSEG